MYPVITMDNAIQILETISNHYVKMCTSKWNVPLEVDRQIAEDQELNTIAAPLRQKLAKILQRTQRIPESYLQSIRTVPRERFVLPFSLPHFAEDSPLPLDESGLSTISAPHAYLLTFLLLNLHEDDFFIESGTGTGYGAALAAHIVGKQGHVISIEYDVHLYERAKRILTLLGLERSVELFVGDGTSEIIHYLATHAKQPVKIAFTHALNDIPSEVCKAMPINSVLVAPIGLTEQTLVRVIRNDSGFHTTKHHSVRYVRDRALKTNHLN